MNHPTMTLTTAAALCRSAAADAERAASYLDQADSAGDADRRAQLIVSALAALQRGSVGVEASRREMIDSLREQGYTWQRVGGLLGMTRQAAWKRFGKGSHRGRG